PETLLFYHPAVWWVSNRLRIERELCCDDEAVRVCGDATAYARALVTMAKLQAPAMAMGSTGGSLSERVRRLLGVSSREPSRSAAWSVMVIGVAFLSVTLANVGAQTKPVRFEVASIKPAPPGASLFSNVEFLPGGVVRGDAVPVFALVAAAYDIPWGVVESESRVMNERFAVEARAGAGTQAETRVMREMLKTLLAERFRLALHVEKRELPMYALRVGANGHTLTPTARDCAPKTATDAARGDALCGVQVDTSPLAMAALYGSPGDGLRLRGSDMSDLALSLGNLLDRKIVDRTGITGRFDIEVPPWSPGLQTRLSDLGPDAEPAAGPNGPSIFSVIKTLGLRLEAIRGPVDVYVVDHVEPPTAN
ncbi:MAG: TIGR03435 family protein, partial [Vicinamibacterales bacterium]